MNRSEQFPCTRVAAFSLTSLFLEQFWSELRISLRFHKQIMETKPLKMALLIFSWRLVFLCHLLYLITRSWTERSFLFRGKKCCKMHLKLNQSVKTSWHGPSMKVALSGLCAPGNVKLSRHCGNLYPCLTLWQTYNGQLTTVKTGYPLTRVTWPYRKLKCQLIEVTFFWFSADQLRAFNWSRAQVKFMFLPKVKYRFLGFLGMV